MLFSSVLDALEDEPGAIDFYIGHELGHIHRGHLVWAPVLAPAAVLPLLGTGLARAHEYTCDRYGLAACESAADARIALAALVAGHTQRKHIDLAAFGQQRRESGGFWMSYHELIGGYPWLSKRVAAIESLAHGEEPDQPSRDWFAFVLAGVTPNLGAGGASSVLVFVATIGILAAIAIPAYQQYINRAVLVEALSQSEPVEKAIERYTIEKGKWPESLEAVGIADPELALGRAGAHRGVLELSEQGYLAVTLAGAPFNGGALVLTPQVSSGRIIAWSCTGNKLPPKMLPAECR
ncbi:MAG: peptidase [Hydrocarboniphaga sp.]|uniref:pilin n=1 Tax=Hydrocarboniphaga sp. TaxID=2033016 RepID=UPI002622E0CE|nr:pilin [Hydrocarboniphaga sp.]MDB5969306.1 peptidase [Hydrocarboniphaga sp.]